MFRQLGIVKGVKLIHLGLIASRAIAKRPVYLNGYSDCQCFALDLLSRIVANPNDSLRMETAGMRLRRSLMVVVGFCASLND